jgi:predicted transposase/invertase (TIGR01784 family)
MGLGEHFIPPSFPKTNIAFFKIFVNLQKRSLSPVSTMKTDSFFYRFFSEFPQAFFVLIGEDEQKSLNYKFTSVEVKEQAFRFDAVFVPAMSADHLYFVEVQFRNDPELYSKMFAEIYLYLRQYKPPNDWRTVVVFPNESFDPGVHPHSREFFESGRLKRVYLNRLPPADLERFPLSLLRIVTESNQELATVVEKIAKQLPNEIPDPKQQEEIVDLLVSFLMSRLTNLSRKEIEKMFDDLLANRKQSRAYQEIAQEVALEVTKQVTQDVTQQVAQQVAYESKRAIALAMVKEKMSPALISKLTGLSQKEVLAISKSLRKPAKARDRKAS